MSNVATKIKDGLKSVPGSIKSIGKDIVSGLWEGISDKFSWLTSKIKGFAKNVTGKLKDFFGIHSPSRVMRDQIGKYLAEGIGVGIEDNSDTPIKALKKLGETMISGVQDINGVTLDRQINTTFGNTSNGGSVGELVNLVSDYFPKLIEASSRSIVLDSGVLVGETIGQIDQRLATNYALKARGI